MEFEEKTISSETVYDGKIINVRLEKVELQDGRIADRELVGHSGGVGIIAVDNDGQVFMRVSLKTARTRWSAVSVSLSRKQGTERKSLFIWASILQHPVTAKKSLISILRAD